MAVPAAAGYDAGAINPERWSSTMLGKYYKSTCWTEITNSTFDELPGGVGTKVHIRTTPDITITAGQKLAQLNPEILSHGEIELEIDKALIYAFLIEDIDKFNSDLNYQDDIQQEAAMKLGIEIDKDIISYATTQVAAQNSGTSAGESDFNLGATGAPVGLTKDNVIEFIQDSCTVLEESDVPDAGRWMVLPPWACGLLRKSDLEDASFSGGQSTVFSGRLGNIGGFTLYRGRNLTKATDNGLSVTNILFGHKDAIAFASNLIKTKSMESENAFAHLIAGLHVYGRKVVKPEALGKLYAYKAA